jgi:hypothetical protein
MRSKAPGVMASLGIVTMYDLVTMYDPVPFHSIEISYEA